MPTLTMSVDMERHFDKWCRLSLSIPLLEQLHLRLAMNHRERLRQALADGLDLTAEDQQALDTADALFAAAAAQVVPKLSYGPWLAARPPEHYAHWYVDTYGSPSER